MIPVSLVTIHHEGSGAPTDVARGADGGYSIWVGVSRYTVLRPPWLSFATLGFNHVSLDICLSGNRMVHPVSDSDLVLIRTAVSEARRNGWVVDSPQVRAHKDSPGSSTVCPGDLTIVRWSEIVAACTKPIPAPAPIVLEDPVLIPAPTQPKPDEWRGAKVDVQARTMIALGGAIIDPPLDPVESASSWQGVSSVKAGEFVIVADTPDKRNNAPYRHTVR